MSKFSSTILKKYEVINCQPFIHNAYETAIIMKNLDIVVTIDSFPLHLSGALGVKTYLMLPFDSEWRWFSDTSSTCWYSSVTIFKQSIPNRWNDVVDRIAAKLKIF